VKKLKQMKPELLVECLLPDFDGNQQSIQLMARSVSLNQVWDFSTTAVVRRQNFKKVSSLT